MTLRKKTLLINVAFFLILLLLLDLTFTNYLRKSAEDLDRQRIEQNLARAALALDGEAQALYSISEIWANADPTWKFMRGDNPDYPVDYLDRSVIAMLGVSSMIFFDNAYNVRLFRDYSTLDNPSAPEREFETIITDHPQNLAMLPEIPISGIKGMVNCGGTPVIFSLQPVFNSDMSREQAGFLLMTRAIDANLIRRLSQNIGFTFNVVLAAPDEKTGTDERIEITNGVRKNRDTISGRMLVMDIKGEPVAWVTGDAKKTDTSATEQRIQMMFLIFAIAGLLFCFCGDRISGHLIWDRLSGLRGEIHEARSDYSRFLVNHNEPQDEFTDLARAVNDAAISMDFSRVYKEKIDDITIRVYERFSQAGNRLYLKTLDDIATAFTPRDENFRASLTSMARTTSDFARRMNIDEDGCLYLYFSALFSRIGLLGIPIVARKKKWELSPLELTEYRKYPIFSREFLEAIELLRPAAMTSYTWKENWDGSGFPRGLSGTAIPFEARLFATVNEWNDMTRPWPGRRLPTKAEVEDQLRERAGTRLDPGLVEEFIKFLQEEAGGNNNENN